MDIFNQHFIELENFLASQNQKIKEFKQNIQNENIAFIGNMQQLKDFQLAQDQKIKNFLNITKDEEEQRIIYFFKTFSHMTQRKVIEDIKANIVNILSFELFQETIDYLKFEGTMQEITRFIDQYKNILSQKEVLDHLAFKLEKANKMINDFKSTEIEQIQKEFLTIKTSVDNSILNFIGNTFACDKNRQEQFTLLEQAKKIKDLVFKQIAEERKKFAETMNLHHYKKEEFIKQINEMEYIQSKPKKFKIYQEVIQNIELEGLFKLLSKFPEKKNVCIEGNTTNIEIIRNIFEPILRKKSAIGSLDYLFNDYTKQKYGFVIFFEKIIFRCRTEHSESIYYQINFF